MHVSPGSTLQPRALFTSSAYPHFSSAYKHNWKKNLSNNFLTFALSIRLFSHLAGGSEHQLVSGQFEQTFPAADYLTLQVEGGWGSRPTCSLEMHGSEGLRGILQLP